MWMSAFLAVCAAAILYETRLLDRYRTGGQRRDQDRGGRRMTTETITVAAAIAVGLTFLVAAAGKACTFHAFASALGERWPLLKSAKIPGRGGSCADRDRRWRLPR